MDLKKLFPLSYQLDLVKSIIYYLVAAIVAGLLIWLSTALTGWIPVVGAIIGWVLGIVSTIIEIYVIAGIIVSILRKVDVIK